MGFYKKRVLAVVTAVSLAVVSLPGCPVAQADAAATVTVSASADAQEQRGDVPRKAAEYGMRGAEETESGATVSFSKSSGTYPDEFDLELSCDADSGAEIYYTTDGSDPSDVENEARQLYTPSSIHIADRTGDPNVLAAIDPVLFDAVNVETSKDGKSYVSTIEKPDDDAVDKCTVIKAAAQYADGTCSEVTTNTYFIGEMANHIEGIRESCEAAGMDLSVMSISMDVDDLFDSTKGIYVKGDIFNQALENYLTENGKIPSWQAVDISRGMDANYKQKGREWERETHIDYFESNGTETACKLQQDCGVRIQGNYSRSDYQKSFRLFARADYGEKNFKYGFWEQAKDDNGDVIKKYKKIVLRNGGNCAFTTKFSDSYWQSLIEGIDCDTQSARPCVVYLNGEYWGVYILQDDFCGGYFENKHGIDKDNILIYKGDAEANRVLGYKLDEGELPEGVTNENYYFTDLENFMKEHDNVSDPADYEALCKMVDKDSALDYFATQVWINNKWDWPGKNWSMWRCTDAVKDPANPYADGKWRYLIYDVEFGGVSGSSDAKANTVDNSNLLATGTDQKTDENWDKPNVRCFALFMTNPEFRKEFNARVESFSEGMFEQEHALSEAERYGKIYEPILGQFFKRFPTGYNSVYNAIHGGYASLQCIKDFLDKRASYIPTITKWVRKQFGDPDPNATPTPTPTPTASPTPTPGGGQNPTATPKNTPAPTAGSDTTIRVPLCDGAKKIVRVDANGKVISTKYNVEGAVYALKSDNTLAFSADNAGSLKKKSAYVIPDVVVAGGNRYKVTEIEAGAFQGLKKLKSVTIGENIKTIGKNAFRGCKKLKKITFLGNKVGKIGSKAFDGIAKKAKVSYPKAKCKVYQKLIKKSGVNLKKTKLTVTKLKQSAQKKGIDTSADSSQVKQNALTESAAGRTAQKKNAVDLLGIRSVLEKTKTAPGHSSAVRRKKPSTDRITSNKAASKPITMSSLAQEDGTYNGASFGSVVTIESAAELKMLSEYTKAGERTYGVTFLQTADIDGTDVTMEPIGTRWLELEKDDEEGEWLYHEQMPFEGTYDGDGHSVQNLNIAVTPNQYNVYFLGMFGAVEEGALRNIDLRSIRFVNAETGGDFVTTEEMTLYMAGIACYGDYSEIENCTNRADLDVTGESVSLAGILAENGDVAIHDCYNEGNLTASGKDASVVGITTSSSYTYTALTGCTNAGDIVANGTEDGNAAGITSYYAEEPENALSDCTNTGNITATDSAAGIAGLIYSEGYGMSKCSNSGEIHAKIAAGLAVVLSRADMLHCENTGVISGSEYAAGIVAEIISGSVSVTKNTGTVTAGTLAGGIVTAAIKGEVSNVQNMGAVTSEQSAGGILGAAAGMKLGNLWNHGAVSGTASVGGITGYCDQSLVEEEDEEDESVWSPEDKRENIYVNCIQLGTVSGGTTMGSIVGSSIFPDQISHCYCLESAALPASGSDTNAVAQKIAADAWTQQSFLDELNQNMELIQSMTLLGMEYNAKQELQWKPQIVIRLGGVEEGADYKLNLVAVNTETQARTTMVSRTNRYYLSNPEFGVNYRIYRIMPDATEKLIDSVALQEDESIAYLTLNAGRVQFYMDGTWESNDQEDYWWPPYSTGKDPYVTLYYLDPQELSMPADPVKAGYEFAGWYRAAYAVNEESYERYREYMKQEFQFREQMYQQWWEEDFEYLLGEYGSQEEFLKEYLTDRYGYSTLEELMANYDAYFDENYKVTKLYQAYDYEDEEDDDYYYVTAMEIYPKWIKKSTADPDKKDPTPQNSPTPTVKTPNPSMYQDKAGDYVQKKGLIYKINRKKKTASIIGVTSKSITKAEIVAKVKTGGKNYKVTAIAKNAFKGCDQLKKITAKGKSLKKIKKKALKMIQKKKK